MKKIKRTIRHIFGGIKGAFTVLFTFMLFPFARLFLWHKKIWIVSERENECRDNGYIFFKHMRENHSEINCHYALKKNSPDYDKIKNLGNVIEFGSFKHFAYYCAARYLICSTTQGFCPSYYLTLLRKKMHLWGTYVFLQHGITKDNQTFLYKKPAKLDLFICGAKPEYEDIVSNYGYEQNQVVYTGFARFDLYHNLSLKNQIIVMPTWRREVYDAVFEDTDYYKTWSSFLNNHRIIELLEKNDVNLYFYIHPVFQKYSHLFKGSCARIVIADFEHYDLQLLLRESKLMITDFSSVAFDFGYMKKPVIYYQYDEKEYFEKHYIKGYFDYRRDGFGPVCNDINDVVGEIANYLENRPRTNKYSVNVERFFPLYDKANSERIYNAIINYKKV